MKLKNQKNDETNVNYQEENKLVAERKSKLASLREAGNPFINDFKPENLAISLHEEFDEFSNDQLQESKLCYGHFCFFQV